MEITKQRIEIERIKVSFLPPHISTEQLFKEIRKIENQEGVTGITSVHWDAGDLPEISYIKRIN